MAGITAEKTIHGAWRLSTVKFDRLVTRTYYFYTKREATEEFREYLKELKD